MELSELLSPGWEELKSYQIGTQKYYLACKVIEILGLSNITVSMGRKQPIPKISRKNWTIELITEVNEKRGVYLFTYDGIVEIIRNNKNARCKKLKLQLDQ
jgi:hypothetical protein